MSDSVEIQFPIQMTDAAATKVKSLITEEENPDLKLRVYITGGGCSGFQYGFTFDEAINDGDGFYRLAEHDGEVVGFVRATTRDDGTKELEAIYIRSDMFGRGLGGQLMSQAMEWVGDESDAVLEVVSYNQRAIRFYEKFGFEKVAGSERMYRDKMPVMTMIRKGAA